ncbi:hypothetical protein SAMN03003324_02211 [Pedobacter antarcticus]|uniref:Uncharacterized protein n=1 Tax=Pedobacter antarcticus TaxID=34086 RepID=A0A1I2FIA9_9SPHI|nr:hypothetical protein SAMN03003324_02211 [Pedobacter antarcticus]
MLNPISIRNTIYRRVLVNRLVDVPGATTTVASIIAEGDVLNSESKAWYVEKDGPVLNST